MKETKYNNLILVPTDFTKQAETAIQHGALIAKQSGYSLLLIHVLDGKSKSKIKKGETSEDELNTKLEAAVKGIKASSGIEAAYKVVPGDIFSSIGNVAEEEKANLIVMGTHGVKGMQHVLGAFALKVITSAPVPTIVVQDKPGVLEGYKTIIYPVDESKENKHKLIHTINLAKVFGSTVHLLPRKHTDSAFIKGTTLNMGYSRKNLEKHGIKVVEVNADEYNSNSHESVMHYASLQNSGLVVIRSHKEKSVKEYLVGPDSVKIINNVSGTAVMCVNPIENLFKVQSAVMLGSK